MASNQYFPTLPSFPGQGTPLTDNLRQPQGNWGSQALFPVNTTQGNPYQVPVQSGTMSTSNPIYLGGDQGSMSPTDPSMKDFSHDLGHGIIATGLQFPGLSQTFANYLMSQIGTGMTPFNLQTMLPTGGITQPGQLSAGMNPLLQQLMQFYEGKGGRGMPGADTLGTIADKGISALPEWQSMIQAQQQNIQQNQANLREQFAGMGGLAGTPFGTAISNYEQQTTKDQNALLGYLQQQNILQGQIPTAQFLQTGANQMGQYGQALDQQAIQNMLQEFIRVQPQNNPLMQYLMGMSTLYPPTTKTPTTSQTAMGWVNSLMPNITFNKQL